MGNEVESDIEISSDTEQEVIYVSDTVVQNLENALKHLGMKS